MRTILLFTASLAATVLLGATGAQAKYSLCNKTSYTLSAAIGYVDGDRLATRGWWRLRPGQCKVVLTEPTDPGRYFVFAEGIAGHKGPLRSWSGDTPLCVENAGFFNLRNQDVCRDDSTRQRNFFDVEVTAAAGGNWQTDFAEAANYTVYSAEVAGVQRLMTDVMDRTGPVNGSLDRETQRLLAIYRKQRNLGEGPVIDEATIDALIEDANSREQKLGLYLCNKTESEVWSAISQPLDGGVYQSKGWWRVPAGECAKVLKGALPADHYFVYGAIEDARGEMRLSGGEKSFCINAVRFESTTDQSCDAQELDQAVFKRIDVKGLDTATFDFTLDKFVAPPSASPAPQ